MQKHSILLKDSVLLLSALCFSHRLYAFHSLDGSNNCIVNNVLKTAFTCCQCGWIGLNARFIHSNTVACWHSAEVKVHFHVKYTRKCVCITFTRTSTMYVSFVDGSRLPRRSTQYMYTFVDEPPQKRILFHT